MTTIITRGSVSAQALGYAARATAANYIEDVFSTYLYTGNGSTQTITNNIDLSTKGGMVWLKSRSAATNHFLFDTSRSALNELNSNTTDAQASLAASLTAFNTTGFSLGAAAGINVSAETYASWTFREQPKFFDVVTYTGNGTARTIAHNLGSVPGCIIVKATSGTGNWYVYHRSLGNTQEIRLNQTVASDSGSLWDSTTPTSTVFSLGASSDVNASGSTYVAYLFAHNAGGFGASGADNVISCGSVTSGATVNLGWQPQWILFKRSDAASDWYIFDTMRGINYNFADTTYLLANTIGSEAVSGIITPVTNGFISNLAGTQIYIAIRRGPMRTPTSGTSVFSPQIYTPTGNTTITTNFVVDLNIGAERNHATLTDTVAQDRLRGGSSSNGALLYTNTTGATSDPGFGTSYASNTSIIDYLFVNYGYNSPTVQWLFSRAPGFFDVVCYTGTGANTTQAHNLTAIPELIIVKKRSATGAWQVYSSALANTQYMVLNTTAAVATGATRWNSTTPTSSVFSIGTDTTVNASAATYVAYLFATVAGVSKVGSYTGSGTTKQIECGFTGGARFVLIKRTDSTGDWYVWDSARGIVAGNDPYLLLNSTAAEVTNTDYVDTYSAGFEISSTAPAAINANGGTFIFLAIA